MGKGRRGGGFRDRQCLINLYLSLLLRLCVCFRLFVSVFLSVCVWLYVCLSMCVCRFMYVCMFLCLIRLDYVFSLNFIYIFFSLSVLSTHLLI